MAKMKAGPAPGAVGSLKPNKAGIPPKVTQTSSGMRTKGGKKCPKCTMNMGGSRCVNCGYAP